ncbi:MAG: phosphoribosylanthranilate isomerase [Acidimicrobiia bacterium]
MLVQIYGFTDPEDVRAVADLKLDHIGVVLDEGFDTWDGVDLHTAVAILDEVPTGTTTVALSLHTDPDLVSATANALRPDIVHVARAERMPSEALAQLRVQLAPMRVMTTVAIRDTSAIDAATRVAAYSDYVLLDTAHLDTGVVGATGMTHDWTLSRQVVEAVGVPVVLAGGLGPENVAAAIRAVRPAGVDSETRTSRSDDRRRKDPERVREFVEIART